MVKYISLAIAIVAGGRSLSTRIIFISSVSHALKLLLAEARKQKWIVKATRLASISV
jgi:hypothetical protein